MGPERRMSLIWFWHHGFSAVYNQKVLGPRLDRGIYCVGSDPGSSRFRAGKKKIAIQMRFLTKIDHSGRPGNT